MSETRYTITAKGCDGSTSALLDLAPDAVEVFELVAAMTKRYGGGCDAVVEVERYVPPGDCWCEEEDFECWDCEHSPKTLDEYLKDTQ